MKPIKLGYPLYRKTLLIRFPSQMGLPTSCLSSCSVETYLQGAYMLLIHLLHKLLSHLLAHDVTCQQYIFILFYKAHHMLVGPDMIKISFIYLLEICAKYKAYLVRAYSSYLVQIG